MLKGILIVLAVDGREPPYTCVLTKNDLLAKGPIDLIMSFLRL